MEDVTIEKMKDFGDCYQAIKWAQEQYGEYPSSPSKPHMAKGHSSAEAEIYVSDLKKYEKAKDGCTKEQTVWRQRQSNIDLIIVEYMKDESGFNDIPEQYRSNVYSKAWQDGHSSGFYEVYQCLRGLVEIFN